MFYAKKEIVLSPIAFVLLLFLLLLLLVLLLWKIIFFLRERVVITRIHTSCVCVFNSLQWFYYVHSCVHERCYVCVQQYSKYFYFFNTCSNPLYCFCFVFRIMLCVVAIVIVIVIVAVCPVVVVDALFHCTAYCVFLFSTFPFAKVSAGWTDASFGIGVVETVSSRQSVADSKATN